MRTIIVFSSDKDCKVTPNLPALNTLFPEGFIELRYRIGETETAIPSQPIGHLDTKEGAVRRAQILRAKKETLKEVLKNKGILTEEKDRWVYIGVENGLVVDEKNEVADLAYVAFIIGDDNPIVSCSNPVAVIDANKKRFKVPEGIPPLYLDKCSTELTSEEMRGRNALAYGHPEGEEALARKGPSIAGGYRQMIVETMLWRKKIDLYQWYTDGKMTRETVVAQAAHRTACAYLDLQINLLLTKELVLPKQLVAKKAIALSAQCGVVASLGARYRHMSWMRDLSVMTPAFLRYGHKEALKSALLGFADRQSIVGQKFQTNMYAS